MKDIIKNILDKAYEEKDLDLANIANDLMGELASTFNCPSDWRNILDELYEEDTDNENNYTAFTELDPAWGGNVAEFLEALNKISVTV